VSKERVTDTETRPSLGPLRGLRVVDFSRLLPGPYASLVLADLGAEVVKIETTKGGDYLRWLPPLAGEHSYAFASLNGGKRSLAVDMKSEEGRAVVQRLCATADVVIESFRPGVMDRLGLSWETLSAANPALVYCAISGYGQDGPYRERAGHDLNYAALAGVVGLAGPHDGSPALAPVQIADIGGGSMWALIGILTKLYARQRTGEGGFIDISMTDGAQAFLHSALAAHVGGGAAPPQRGRDTLTGGQSCYAVYETQGGGFFSVAALEPKFWKRFCEAIHRPDLVSKQFGSPRLIETTRGEIAAIFKTKTRDEWTAVFEFVDACCEPVLRPEELLDHPLHQARQAYVQDQAGIRRLRTPVRARDAEPPGRAPALGEHTAELLAELGYDSAEIEQMKQAGVVAMAERQ
jgi:alpha-methylacyl-CoA racemase